ncbi:MAG: MBL fold metallo-hydrolase, partial [bacterium]|nr:MBL fold metallo-hydrolase [bacterium]
MQMQWYGHSCFLLTSGEGVRILTDPCAPTTGYRLRDIEADAVTSSHAHYDHNYFVAAAGSPA